MDVGTEAGDDDEVEEDVCFVSFGNADADDGVEELCLFMLRSCTRLGVTGRCSLDEGRHVE